MSYIGNEPVISAIRTVTEATATAGQTVFNPAGGYTVGYLDVFVNGVQLNSDDFTATNGSSVTLTSACAAGDAVRLVAWGIISLTNVPSGSLTTGGPTWSSTGGVTLPRIDSSNEGGQLNFNRASDNTATWSIDSFGNTSTPSLRFLDGANVRMALDGSGNVGIGISSPASKLDVNGAIRDSLGNVRSIPQNAQTSAYTLVAADNGRHISITTGGVTVPSGVFSIGDVVTVFNNSTSNQTITQGASVTMRQAGTANTGNRTIAQYGIATIVCVASNTFVITGSGVT